MANPRSIGSRRARAAISVALGSALVAGGLPVLEVTLRTPVALDAIRAMKAVPGAIVGAGTVTNEAQLDAVLLGQLVFARQLAVGGQPAAENGIFQQQVYPVRFGPTHRRGLCITHSRPSRVCFKKYSHRA